MRIHSQIKSAGPDLGYRPDIDGLRAVAVLSVVVFHAFPAYLPGGFAGVDVFFVISGFLISSIIFKGLDSGTFSIRTFYERRVRRIFPSLLTVLIFCLVLGWFVLLPDEYQRLGLHSAGGASFIANLIFWDEAGYFDARAHAKPLLHLWSLGVEEQFYLVWPLLAILLWRWLPRHQWRVVVGMALASFALNIAIKGYMPEAAFYSPLTRLWELLAGALLAFHAQRAASPPGRWPRLMRIHPEALSVLGIALLVAAFVVIDKSRSFPGWWAILPVLGSTMIILAGARSRVNALWLSSRPMVLVGLISYPLYLWHWPLLSYAYIIEGKTPSIAIRSVAVALSLVLAWGSWRLIETPVRKSKGRAAFAVLLFLGIMLAALGYAVYLKDGMPQRMTAYTERLAELVWEVEKISERSCKERFTQPALSYCLESTPGAAHQVALIGDSFANQYFVALNARYQRLNKSMVNLGRGQCPVLRGIETTRPVNYSCEAISNYVLDYVLSTPSIETVIIADRWRRDVGGKLKHRRLPAETKPATILQAGIEDTVAELLAAGKRVVIVSGTPELPYVARSCVRFRPFYLSKREHQDRCAMPRSSYEKYARAYKQVLANVKAKYPALMVVDPAVPLCDKDWCHGRVDGRLVFRDSNHFSHAGAELAGEYMFKQISAAEAPAPAIPND